MKGKHHIIIEAPRLKYEFTIRRNITILRGDSATGKTTLIDLLSDYRTGDSAIRIESDVPCRVFSDGHETWKQSLEVITDSIVFIDEENDFIKTQAFAETVKGSTNYFVLITREFLPELPYSICEVYGIRTSGRYHFPEQIYHEFYPIYSEVTEKGYHSIAENAIIITEDAKSGHQFFRSFCRDDQDCISAEGNAGILRTLTGQSKDTPVAVIADGAAFGAFIENVLQYAMVQKNVILYFPESFEWILLQSGVASDQKIILELEQPENYISSEQYMSWEQFFTDLLIQITKDDALPLGSMLRFPT